MFSSQNELDMVECPYNKAHRMQRKRLQPHLIKCRSLYPDVELQKCPFNQTHLIPEPEFVHHVTSCPDRKLITQYKYDAPEVKEEEIVKHKPIECDENWDDTEVEDYNPQKYLEHANVLRRPTGTQPSQRKAFIKKERKRLGDNDSDDGAMGRSRGRQLKREEPSVSDEEKFVRTRPITPPAPSMANWHPGPRREYALVRDRSRSPKQWRPPNFRPYSPSRRRRDSPSPRRRDSPSRRRRDSPDYDLDDDPYYNGGGSGCSSREDEQSISSADTRSRYEDERRLYGHEQPFSYSRDPYGAGRRVYYPDGGDYFARGAYRGHPYERRYVSSMRGHSMFM